MKQLLGLICILFCSFLAKAQEPKSTTLNLYGNYMFKDKVNFDAYYAYVNEAFQYGIGIEHFVRRNKSVEFKYLRTDTRFPLYSPAGTHVNNNADKGSLNYYLIGGNTYFTNDMNAKLVPYAGAALGLGVVAGQKSTGTKFGWDAKFGVKLKTSGTVSFKLQATIQSVISSFGSDFWVTGGGAVISGPAYASIFQFGLGGALCFDFKKK